MKRALYALVVILTLAIPADAAIFAAVWQVFSDNSCRTFAWDAERNCHGVPTIWCDPNQPTCEAMTAAWSMPSCVYGGGIEPIDRNR